MYKPVLALLILLSLKGISQIDQEKKLQSQLILADNKSIITLEEGIISLSKSISMDGKKNITIKGAGMDKTILSFKGQTSGAEGLKFSIAKTLY